MDLSRPPGPLSGPQNWNPAQPGLGLGHSGFGGSPLGVPWRLRLRGGKLCGDSRVLFGRWKNQGSPVEEGHHGHRLREGFGAQT